MLSMQDQRVHLSRGHARAVHWWSVSAGSPDVACWSTVEDAKQIPSVHRCTGTSCAWWMTASALCTVAGGHPLVVPWKHEHALHPWTLLLGHAAAVRCVHLVRVTDQLSWEGPHHVRTATWSWPTGATWLTEPLPATVAQDACS